MSKYGVFSCPSFLAFGLNTERYLRIQSEYGKIRTRISSYLDSFHAVYDINRHIKCKMWLSIIMMVIWIKQHLSNIWNSIHKEVKQHWGWVGKQRCLWKSVYILKMIHVAISLIANIVTRKNPKKVLKQSSEGVL